MKEQNRQIDAAHQDLHRVPQQYLAVPAHIHVVGFVNGPDNPTEPQAAFLAVAGQLGIDREDIRSRETSAFAIKSAQNGRVLLKLDAAQDHYAIQAWWVEDAEPAFGRLPAYPKDLEFSSNGKLTELDICWLGSAVSDEEVRSHFAPETEVLSSAVLGGKLRVATNYEPDAQGRERYLVFPVGDGMLPGQAEFVVDNIVRIENHFHLLYRPMTDFDNATRVLREIETGSTAEMQRLNESLPTATTETLKESLHELSAGFAKLATLNTQFQHRFSAAITYKDILRTAFQAWREQPLDNYLPLSAPILRSSTTISGDYGQLLARVERVRKQKADVINILRTKIDLLERDQSMALQRNMHETAKSQMTMQVTIEGLYIFIVAFYLTELARIVFEALEERGIIETSPSLLAAFFIPVALAAGLILSGKAGHWIHRFRSKKTDKTK